MFKSFATITIVKSTRVILVGSISIDRIMSFGGLYQDLIDKDKLDVLSLSILVDSLDHSRGGVAANIAYNLTLLGDSPTLLASIGVDGLDYLHYLECLGVDTSRVHKSKLATSSFTVLTDSKGNQVGGFYPGAMGDSASLTLQPWYNQNPLVVISAYDPATMQRLVHECKDHNLPLLYDPGQQVNNVSPTDLAEGLSCAKILMVNEYELNILTKKCQISKANLLKQVPIVITTRGEKGSTIEGREIGKPLPIKAVKVEHPVDPTGAGDAYRAGFIYGYTRDWELTECAMLASTLASYTVESNGTQQHSPSLADIKERYYHTYGYATRL